MTSAKELKRWLNTLPKGAQVGIDEGGLALRVVGDYETYNEIGGLPQCEECESEALTPQPDGTDVCDDCGHVQAEGE